MLVPLRLAASTLAGVLASALLQFAKEEHQTNEQKSDLAHSPSCFLSPSVLTLVTSNLFVRYLMYNVYLFELFELPTFK